MHIQDLSSFFTSQPKAKDTPTSQSFVSTNQQQQQQQQRVEYYFHHRNLTTNNITNGADHGQHFNKIENGSSAPISLIPKQTLPPNANHSYYYESWGEDEEGAYSSSYSTLASTPSSITQFSSFPVGDSSFSTAATASNCHGGSWSSCPSADDEINSLSVHSDTMTNMSSSLSIAGQGEPFDYDQIREDPLMDTVTDHIPITQEQPSENCGSNVGYNKEAFQDVAQQNQLFFTFHNDNKQSTNNIYSASNAYATATAASSNIVDENDLSYLPYFVDEQEVENFSKNDDDDNVEHNSQEFSLCSRSARNQEPSVSLLPATDEVAYKRRRLATTDLSWSSSAASLSGTTDSLILVESEKCCRICGSNFSRSRDRKRHEDSVHGVFLLYQCDLCGKRFGRSDIRKKHRGNKTCIRNMLSQFDE